MQITLIKKQQKRSDCGTNFFPLTSKMCILMFCNVFVCSQIDFAQMRVCGYCIKGNYVKNAHNAPWRDSPGLMHKRMQSAILKCMFFVLCTNMTSFRCHKSFVAQKHFESTSMPDGYIEFIVLRTMFVLDQKHWTQEKLIQSALVQDINFTFEPTMNVSFSAVNFA